MATYKPKPPIRVASKKPTRKEAAVAKLYCPRMITAKIVGQMLGLKPNTVHQRMHRYRKRMGIIVRRSRPKRLPKFAQLSACGSF